MRRQEFWPPRSSGAWWSSALVVFVLKSAVKVIQQGSVGVVKRLGEFRSIRQPGLAILTPFVDQMEKVDMREFPQVGDQQAVITKDNVSVMVSATIFCQVIDVKSALFEINDFLLAIDQLSKTALRAVFGELSLDESLSQREQINTRMQDHMADATMKWGVRLNRIEILDIRPPNNVLQAMSEQKEAEQHKRAAILKSEGDQQAAINTAQGQKQAEVLKAEGAKQSAILAAEAQKQSLQLRAEGEKVATQLRGEGEAALLSAIDTVADQHQHAGGAAAARAPGGRHLADLEARRALRGGRADRRGRGARRGARRDATATPTRRDRRPATRRHRRGRDHSTEPVGASSSGGDEPEEQAVVALRADDLQHRRLDVRGSRRGTRSPRARRARRRRGAGRSRRRRRAPRCRR